MKNFLVKTIGTAGFVAALTVAGLAQQTPQNPSDPNATQTPGGRHGHFGGRGFEGRDYQKMFSDLGLSDAQKAQISAIQTKYQNDPTRQAAFQDMRALRQQMKQGGQLTADQQAQLQKDQQTLFDSRKQEHQELLSVLTDAQRAQLKQKMQTMHQRHKPQGAPTTNGAPSTSGALK